jgi:hypothetical protein
MGEFGSCLFLCTPLLGTSDHHVTVECELYHTVYPMASYASHKLTRTELENIILFLRTLVALVHYENLRCFGLFLRTFDW